MAVEQQFINLSAPDPQFFIDRFWSMVSDYKTYEDAYEALEKIYENALGRRRYSDYNSFRRVRDRKRDNNHLRKCE